MVVMIGVDLDESALLMLDDCAEEGDAEKSVDGVNDSRRERHSFHFPLFVVIEQVAIRLSRHSHSNRL